MQLQSATGAYTAAKAADWVGQKTDKDYGKDKPTATEGVYDAMGKVIGINSGIVGAAGTAGTAKAAPGAVAAGRSLINQGLKAPKVLGKEAKQAVQNPKVSKPGNAVGDFISLALPTGAPAPSKAGYAGGFYGEVFDVESQINEGFKWLEKRKK